MSHRTLCSPCMVQSTLWLCSSPCYPPSPHLHSSPQVLDYDYYGAYSQEQHRDYTYNQLLADEYTFDFPPHHNIVSAVWGHIWSWWGWWRPQSPCSTLPLGS